MIAAFFAVIAFCALILPSVAADDDYPYRGLSPYALEVDEWRFFKATCTSFVAWRLNTTNGVAFNCYYKGAHWGNAAQWDDTARALGIRVDDVPAVGAVAQTNDGTALGHVAWVSAVSGDMVTVEEYNYGHISANGLGGFRRYNVRTVPASSFCYIHIKDLDGDYDPASNKLTDAASEQDGAANGAAIGRGGAFTASKPIMRSPKAMAISAKLFVKKSLRSALDAAREELVLKPFEAENVSCFGRILRERSAFNMDK